jgi:hypothetical protein
MRSRSGFGLPAALGFLGGAGAGAGVMWLCDPQRGAQRRAMIRDRSVHLAREAKKFLRLAGRDAAHRARGVVIMARDRAAGWEPVDDGILVERVRSVLGHHVGHVHPVRVSACDGLVTLAGPIGAGEADTALRAAARVPGVYELVDLLEEQPVGGRRAPRPAPTPAACLARAVAGALLAVLAALKRGKVGGVAGLAGAGLLARAAVDAPRVRRGRPRRRPEAAASEATATSDAGW